MGLFKSYFLVKSLKGLRLVRGVLRHRFHRRSHRHQHHLHLVRHRRALRGKPAKLPQPLDLCDQDEPLEQELHHSWQDRQ